MTGVSKNKVYSTCLLYAFSCSLTFCTYIFLNWSEEKKITVNEIWQSILYLSLKSENKVLDHSLTIVSSVIVKFLLIWKNMKTVLKLQMKNVYQQHVHYFVETYLNEWYQYKHCPESTDRETQLTESSSSSVGSWYKKKHVKIIIQF